MRQRAREFIALFRRARVAAERIEPTHLQLRLHGSNDAFDAARDLFAKEQACCPFYAVQFAESRRTLQVDVRVPSEAEHSLEAFEWLAQQALGQT
jgi:hypothetical protein